MCTDTIESQEVIGEATEVAITNAAVEINLRKRDLYYQMQRINEIFFEFKRK